MQKGLFFTLGICLIPFLFLNHACGNKLDTEIAQELPDIVDFNWHIRPILSDRCYACHGPDENVREANLRLDTEEGAFAALEEGEERYGLIAGDPDNSSVIRRIESSSPETIMPPPESNLRLSEYEIRLLRKWVEQGAKWKTHWAFSPAEKVEVPTDWDSWAQNEIDYFSLRKMQEEGFSPNEAANKGKLLRRLSFDLTGLPPSWEEIEAFENNTSTKAVEEVVDKLLGSPTFGERMASIWLDAARYADSHGYQDDRPRTMWPWRDWVIDAFNKNIPYDSFLIKQVAGDLLPHASYDDKLATGFNRNHAITQEGGVVNEEYVTEYVADRMQTFSTAFLGLTMECARCHDHKYDPLSQKDYYQLFAFFNTIDERGQVNYFDLSPKPHIKMQDAEYEQQLAYVDSLSALWEKEQVDLLESERLAFQQWKASEKLDNIQESNGLTAYFKLDTYEGLNTPNQQAGGHAKMNTGLVGEVAVVEKIIGRAGQALRFDGENFLNLGDLADKEYYEHFAYGAWIKLASYPEKDAGILVKRNGEQKRGGHQLLVNKKGKLKSSLIHNAGSHRIDVESISTIPRNKWTHVWMSYEGTGKANGIQLYIDGKLQKTRTLSDKLDKKSILNGNDFLAGNWTHRKRKIRNLQGFVAGAIDDIRIFDRSLSPLEVKAIAGNTDSPNNDELFSHFLKRESKTYRQLQHKLDSLRPLHGELPYIMVMEEMDSVRATYILDRGAYDALGDRVYANTPSKLLTFPTDYPKNRLGLAKWMTHPQHPLTARVAVNRIWQMLFGRGLVNTPEDFGSQGALPTHPELLDWLAVDFQENGWDIKALIKKIVLSATYQQSSDISEEKRLRDKDNLFLARGPIKRLSSEMIRDNALAISGLLDNEVGGPWVKPYQPAGVWKELANQIGENKYRASKGNGLYRRSLYSYWKRTIPPPSMLTFDAAERSVCVVKRQSTSTPLQSLVLLNDPQYVEASRLLAARMLKEEDLQAQLQQGFRLATSRDPLAKEIEVLVSLFESEKERFLAEKEAARSFLEVGQYQVLEDFDTAEFAAMSIVANMLLNLDEAKMKS
ncbi:MAG: DUF1553 domain-containing protein [Bacteroidota bacterium]